MENRKAKKIALYSPAGGTGKTSLCMNLAQIEVKKGKRVLLIDFTLFGGLEMYFRIPEASGKGLGPLITYIEQNAGEQDTVEMMHQSIYKESGIDNLHILIAPGILMADALDYVLTQRILKELDKLNYDLILCDCSSELSSRTVAVLEACDIVITPMRQDYIQSWRLLKFKEIAESLQLDLTKFKFVLNTYDKSISFDAEELSEISGFPYIGSIYNFGAQAMENQNEGKCWAELEGWSVSRQYKQFVKLTGDLLE